MSEIPSKNINETIVEKASTASAKTAEDVRKRRNAGGQKAAKKVAETAPSPAAQHPKAPKRKRVYKKFVSIDFTDEQKKIQVYVHAKIMDWSEVNKFKDPSTEFINSHKLMNKNDLVDHLADLMSDADLTKQTVIFSIMIRFKDLITGGMITHTAFPPAVLKDNNNEEILNKFGYMNFKSEIVSKPLVYRYGRMKGESYTYVVQNIGSNKKLLVNCYKKQSINDLFGCDTDTVNTRIKIYSTKIENDKKVRKYWKSLSALRAVTLLVLNKNDDNIEFDITNGSTIKIFNNHFDTDGPIISKLARSTKIVIGPLNSGSLEEAQEDINEAYNAAITMEEKKNIVILKLEASDIGLCTMITAGRLMDIDMTKLENAATAMKNKCDEEVYRQIQCSLGYLEILRGIGRLVINSNHLKDDFISAMMQVVNMGKGQLSPEIGWKTLATAITAGDLPNLEQPNEIE